MKTVLVVAAEHLELKWIIPRREGVQFIKVANGPGPRLIRAALEPLAGRVDAVLSTGLCGGLDPALEVGDVVIASSVNGRPVQLPGTQLRAKTGPVVSLDAVVGHAEEKRRLARSGAVAVEMEAAAVLEWAERQQLPFFCVRAVSDTADENFVLDLNAARDAQGRFSRVRIVLQALRRPVAGVPELLRLRRNSARAARALGEFVGKCDF